MIPIQPTRIPGRWIEGYALDLHTEVSRHVGDDDRGHPLFETARTPVGDLLYRLKYRGDTSAAHDLVGVAADFVRQWSPPVNLLVPVPASRDRARQPVALLASALAQELRIELCLDCVHRTGISPELKNVRDRRERIEAVLDAYAVDRARIEGRSILLFDDLYRSGTTTRSVTEALYGSGAAAAVYGLTLTRTRSRR